MKIANSNDKNKKINGLLIFVASIICVFIIYTGISYYYNYYSFIKLETKAKLNSSLSLSVKEFEIYKQEHFNIVKRIRNNEKLYANLSFYLKNRNKTSDYIISKYLKNIVDVFKIHRLIVFDSNYIPLKTIPERVDPNYDEAIEKQVKSSVRAKSFFWKDLYYDSSEKKSLFLLTLPVFENAREGKYLGIICIMLDPETSLFPNMLNLNFPTETGEIYLLKNKNTHLNNTKNINNLGHFDKTDYSKKKLCYQHDTKKLKGIGLEKEFDDIEELKNLISTDEIITLFERTDESGVKYYAVLRAIPKSSYYLLARIDVSEVYGDFYTKIYYLLFLSVLSIVGLFFFVKNIYDSKNVHHLNTKLSNYNELVVNEERLKRTEIIAGSGNWELDLRTKSVCASEGAIKIYGTDKTKLTLDEIQEFPLKEFRASLDAALINLITHNFPYDIDFKIKRKNDGKILDVHSTARYDKELHKVYGVIRDVTESNKIKNLLQKTEERLRLALDASTDGVWDWDFEKDEIYWSAQAYTMLGYGVNEFKVNSEKLKELIFSDDLVKFKNQIRTSSNISDSLISVEARVKNSYGDYTWILIKGKKIFKNDIDSILRIIGTISNIHERKIAELELKKIEWMLSKKGYEEDKLDKVFYINTEFFDSNEKVLQNNINIEILKGIIDDYLGLTSSASSVFEHDGSWGFGVFISDWCRFLVKKSFELTGAKDYEEAANSGKWLCYESCYKHSCKNSIQNNGIMDIRCNGGIKVFSVPILSEEKIIGSINLTYSDPPKDKQELARIAGLYSVSIEELQEISDRCLSRPDFIINYAKERVKSAAKLIATLVEKQITERNLLENQEKYKSFLESSDSVLVLCSYEGNILFSNSIAANYLNLDKKSIVGVNIKDIFPEEIAFKNLNNIQRVISTGEGIVEESESLINNQKIWFRTSCQPVRNSEGVVYAALINADDITDSYKIQSELKDSEERFRQFMNYFPAGVFIKDQLSKVIYANHYFENELDAAAWYGKNPIEIFGEAIGKEMIENDINALKSGYVKVDEFVPHKDGKIHFYETHKFAIKIENKGDLIGGISIDVTDTKNSEIKLKDIQARQDAILASVPDLIVEVDLGKTFTWANKAALEFFGKSIVGEPVTHYSFDGNNIFDTSFIEESSFNDLYYLENKHVRNDGKVCLLGWWCKVLKNDDDIEVGFIATGRDITDSKKAEKEIVELNRMLDQKVLERTNELEIANKELHAFTYSVSHDLRSPLRAIDGFSSILVDEYKDSLDKEGLRFLEVIRQNAKKMDCLITDLLALSRVTQSSITKQEISMTEFVTEIFNETVPDDTKSKFKVFIGNLVNANADPAFLKQVWVNLINNSIKYTLPKGDRSIEIGCYQEPNQIVYFIKDSGVGFNQEYSHKLFGVFQRLHKIEEFEGTGVGLALVKRIIDKHGGEVRAVGELNKGATFYFSLPLN